MGEKDQLLTTKEVVELTGIPENTIRFWRYMADGRGPKSFTLGRRTVRYRKSDVLQWLEDQYAQTASA